MASTYITVLVQLHFIRATRIKVQSHTLDESDGTGHCPSIGTGVFSVDSVVVKPILYLDLQCFGSTRC